MSEARKGCAVLEDTDEQTFVRFGQYLYTGDYEPAESFRLLDASMIGTEPEGRVDAPPAHDGGDEEPAPAPAPEPEPEPDPDGMTDASVAEPDGAYLEPSGWGSERPAKKTKPAKKKCIAPWEPDKEVSAYTEACHPTKSALRPLVRFQALKYAGNFPPFSPEKNTEPCQHFTDVFLSHARVYVFAEKYDIARLRTLSLKKLHQTLCGFTIFQERTGDLAELLQYTYDNTADRMPETDDLRALVVHYFAENVEELAGDGLFREMLMGKGRLAVDLLQQMLRVWRMKG